MKITEELKEKLGGAASEEEIKTILAETKQNVEEAGVILDDEELDRVAGGAARGLPGGSAHSQSRKGKPYPWQV